MLRTVTIVAALALAVGAAGASAATDATGRGPGDPAPVRVAASFLTRILRGDDGGALYLRQLGDKVYGFGEHPGRKYAYVLTGSVSGDRISGSWWDVPKGTRGEKGSLELRWSQGGARIVRSGGDDLGPDVFTGVPADGIPWPSGRAAGFQSTTTGDLDGVFVGEDRSRHYVRETSYNTVWVAERDAQPGERPGWVTVFAGKRNPGGFAGTYVDVPKGLASASGSFGAALVGGERRLALAQPGAGRTASLRPEYALDWDRFASGISSRLKGKVAGYAYAIANKGAMVRSGAGGVRRLEIDGGRLPFTPHTYAQTASAAKTISAAAIIKALHERGLTVDAGVAPFLPSCVARGPGVGSLTFRQLLNHTSGLPGGKASGTGGSCNGSDPYDCLMKILAAGRTQSRANDYNNKAYDLLRLLVPLVAQSEATTGEFLLHDCRNTAGVLNRKVSERFVRYLRTEILEPAGAEASFAPTGNFSLNYRCERRLTDCEPQVRGEAPRADFYLRSGSGKMTISAIDYVQFLTALDHGEIIPKPLVESMKGTPGNRLGFDTTYGGTAGGYHWKNGGCPDFGGKGRSCKTLAMVFPGEVQAYVTVNSSNNTYTGGLQGVVGSAFDAALR